MEYDSEQVKKYLVNLTKIERIANNLTAFVDEHGGMEPGDVDAQTNYRLHFALVNLRAACEILGIDLAVQP